MIISLDYEKKAIWVDLVDLNAKLSKCW